MLWKYLFSSEELLKIQQEMQAGSDPEMDDSELAGDLGKVVSQEMVEGPDDNSESILWG